MWRILWRNMEKHDDQFMMMIGGIVDNKEHLLKSLSSLLSSLWYYNHDVRMIIMMIIMIMIIRMLERWFFILWVSPQVTFLNGLSITFWQVTFLGEPAGFHGARDTRVSLGKLGMGPPQRVSSMCNGKRPIFEMGNSSRFESFPDFPGYKNPRMVISWGLMGLDSWWFMGEFSIGGFSIGGFSINYQMKLSQDIHSEWNPT